MNDGVISDGSYNPHDPAHFGKPVKIIFLDIDGVLNDNNYRLGDAQILPRCVEQFNRIIACTEARIVLSSSWRMQVYKGWHSVRGFSSLLESHGVRGWLLGCTPPDGEHENRGQQVLAWLKAKEAESPVMDAPVTSWVALDDWDDEMVDLGDRFVHTDGGVGLTKENADKAIEILRRRLPLPDAKPKEDCIDRLGDAINSMLR